MAHKIAQATGNFGTAGTWYQGTNTPTIHASTNVNITTTPSYSATFTAPNTTNAVNGVLVHLTSKGSATTLTATLQEATVDTAHTVTVNMSDIELGWVYLRPVTPYVFTATTAGRYRWKLTVDTSTATVAQASTANFAYISVDDRTGVPVSGDNGWIVEPNGTTDITVTMDGTRTVGTGTNAGTERSVANALLISNDCQLQMDTAASSDLTIRGSVWVKAGGEFSCATTSSPLSSSYTATVQAGTHPSSIYYENGATGIWQGASKTYQKTIVASGDGTTGTPLITSDAVDWAVGDEVIFAPATDSATNYNETEVKYIRTKNSSTSYTLADTAGGAESGLTYTHTGALVGNFTNNITIKGSTTAILIGFTMAAQSSAGFINVDWVRFENLHNSTFFGAVPTGNVQIPTNCALDNCVGKNGPAGIFYFNQHTNASFSNILTYNTQTTTGLLTAFANTVVYASNGVTLTNCHSFASNGYGFGIESSYSCTIQDSSAYACNNTGAASGGVAVNTSGLNTFNNFNSHAHYSNGIYIASGPFNTFNSCLIGTKGDMPNGLYMGTGFSTALFNDTFMDATNVITNYTNMTLGSEIKFNRLDDTDNNHRWYSVRGWGKAEDTEIRTTGSLAVRLAPQNSSTGFAWEFQIPAKANSIVAFFGYFMKNTAFSTDDVVIELWLPGSTVADASYTLADSYDVWQAVPLSVSNTLSVDGLATVKVIGKTTTSAAYVYCDDFYNAGNTVVSTDKVTGLDTWFEGKPAQIITPSAVSAADIWTFDTTNLTTANTTGNQQKKLLTVSKFLGLK
jgi:hypothetical protein